jgi:predicted TIM-barrel fold metal-dependent hydrolase
MYFGRIIDTHTHLWDLATALLDPLAAFSHS